MANSAQFYQNLPLLDSFADVLQSKHHQNVPADWWIALTDVVNSTQAIENGRYKDVNAAGGLAAMALSNANEGMDFPFVFGGDGITCLIPPHLTTLAHDILYDTAQKVKAFFDLQLRVALIPLKDLHDRGKALKVAKLRVSEYYHQAILSGEALIAAEQLLKDEWVGQKYLIRQKKQANILADFTGFTCRWQDIPSSRGETISTIILLRSQDTQQLLDDIMKQLYHIFGQEEDFHPITMTNLNIAHSSDELKNEAKAVSGQASGLKFRLRLAWIKFETWITQLAMQFKLKVKVDIYELHRLKDYQVAASDFKKFDGSLKMVLNCHPEDRQKWQQYLESLHQDGQIYYGIHVADRAIMTCLLHAGSEKEVHFIDAADGGYTLAAKQLKQQMVNDRESLV
ncbi:MAG: DUF3095 domain-containing protein [Bacteroidota bacterium]